jgi:hypothetical protein
MTPAGRPRIYEIDGPRSWVELVNRYPLEVTSSRRQDWFRVTGRDGRWHIPDWLAVSEDWDAVHLTVVGYLTTATRLLQTAMATGTLVTGWDPDQAWWLTDVLTAQGAAGQHWYNDPDEAGSEHHWRQLAD